MATESNVALESFPANADLSASQDCFVTINSSGKVAVTGDGLLAHGVLKNNPGAADSPAAVMTKPGYKVIVKTGGAFAVGARVSSDSTGRATALASGDYIMGIACEASGAANEYVPILFAPNGRL